MEESEPTADEAAPALRGKAVPSSEAGLGEETAPALRGDAGLAGSIPREDQFHIQLPSFEGPLDLLLHLIKKHELEILDLPIAFVTERYLEYLRVMRDLDLEVAGEYLLMAATLAHIKSKMLLPQVPAEQQDDDENGEPIDPRLELIRRLLEYQKYKNAAENLGGRAVAGRDVFGRGLSVEEIEGPAPLAEIGLFRLLDAFQGILDRAQDRRALEVTAESISIKDRIAQITELLRERRNCEFASLFAGDVTRYEVVVTFLALLEMTKMRLARIYQVDHQSPIHVQYALLDADAPTIPPPEAETATAAPVLEPAPQEAEEE
jgi:segregation and condensation protein A